MEIRMSVLVLGSEGFVGSAICDDLLANGYRVVGIDTYLKGYTPTKHFSHSNFRFINYDLTLPLTHEVGEDCDIWIIAAATLGGVSYFHDNPFDMIGYNSLLMSQICLSAERLKPKKIVYLSSSMVYENVIKFPSKEDDLELYPAPDSAYGFAKLTGERMIKALSEQHGISYSICRLFNCVGTDEKFDLPFKQGSVHVLPEFVYTALTSESDVVNILGNGEQIRCFTDKRDLARGIRLAAEYNVTNECFNISTPTPTPVSQLLKKVWMRVRGTSPTIVTGKSLPYDVQVRIPNVDKATRKLGFRTEYQLDTSIDEVISWMKTQLKQSTKE
jgi:nucleoside-diphosphate-sugar epimerase